MGARAGFKNPSGGLQGMKPGGPVVDGGEEVKAEKGFQNLEWRAVWLQGHRRHFSVLSTTKCRHGYRNRLTR